MENKNVLPKRQIIIETDGVTISLPKTEVSSLIEFNAILNMVLDYVNKEANKIKQESLEKSTPQGNVVPPDEKAPETK